MGYDNSKSAPLYNGNDGSGPELGPPTGQPQMGQPNQNMQPQVGQANPNDNLANGADPTWKPQVASFNAMMGNPWDNNKVSTGGGNTIGKGKS